MASLLPLVDAGRVSREKEKKTKKRAQKDFVDSVMRRGVIYVGRLPHGFYEIQLKEYFSQFGTVTKVHVSRNKKVCTEYSRIPVWRAWGRGRYHLNVLSLLTDSYFDSYLTQTGNCKGFGFVEFECDEVAKIAAQTMNNYLMFNKLLKCEFC